MSDRRLVLVCNSHIDPVWLWPWEEGLAATLATFRAAARLCEEFDDFVFCHNEALLYGWVEEWEPALFERIQRLVKRGRWHIMGGWFLQPDCNLPSGESLVRQVLTGRRYFADKFGVTPSVAINFDPFGHTRGLVQILAKAGYTGYLFCRPDRQWLPLPADDFVWVGYDGSTVVAHRAADHYNSSLGQARPKVEAWLSANPDRPDGLLLWGVGNHGGGASRQDLSAIAELARSTESRSIVHGRPEDYFAGLGNGAGLPHVERDLNPWAVGCYTSMATVKQAHARLERSYFAAEAMQAAATLHAITTYPRADLRTALSDLLYCQFHDILPGEGIREVERQAMERLGHGQEIVSRLRTRAFFALLEGQPQAAEGEYPVCVYNHHAFPVETEIACEFQAPEPNVDTRVFWQVSLTGADGTSVPVQIEKESCNIQNDHRKRLVFRPRLAPSSMSRFSCRLVEVPAPAPAAPRALAGPLVVETDGMRAVVDPATGLLSCYSVDGHDVLAAPGVQALLLADSNDPWGMKVRGFGPVVDTMRLMSPEAAARFAGVNASTLPPVRIIESGAIRTVVEALFEIGESALCLRYKLPTKGRTVEIEALVSWHEKARMLKLAFPVSFARPDVQAQVAYGIEPVRTLGDEHVSHRWIAATDGASGHTLTIITEFTSGFDVTEQAVRLSLLRSPAYAGHPVDAVTPIVKQDRFEPREDEGLHTFRFWLAGGLRHERLDAIDSESAARTSEPMALNVFPTGSGRALPPAVVIDDPAVRLAALKLADTDGRLVVRLFESTGAARQTTVHLPALNLDVNVRLASFELKTLAIDPHDNTVVETDLLERPCRQERHP